MHQHLELKVLRPVIQHLERRLETAPGEGDAIHETEFKRPCAARLLAQHVMGQTEVKRDGVVAVWPILSQRLRRRLAQECPGGVPRKSMLRKRRRSVVLRRAAKDLF